MVMKIFRINDAIRPTAFMEDRLCRHFLVFISPQVVPSVSGSQPCKRIMKRDALKTKRADLESSASLSSANSRKMHTPQHATHRSRRHRLSQKVQPRCAGLVRKILIGSRAN